MDSNRRHLLAGAAALGLARLTPAWAQAEAWPTRPLRIVVPYPPGGSSDIIARIIAPRLADALTQTVVVENKPGANGNLGAGIVVQSAQEGHTVLLCDVGALAISPSVYTRLSFDPSKDLRAVSMLAYSPHVLAVHPDVPARTVPELVALSKKQRLNFAVTAIGSAPHLAAVAVQQATGAQWEYVPYKGGSQAVTDTIGGQTQIIMNGLLATLPHIKSGKLRAIAISKGAHAAGGRDPDDFGAGRGGLRVRYLAGRDGAGGHQRQERQSAGDPDGPDRQSARSDVAVERAGRRDRGARPGAVDAVLQQRAGALGQGGAERGYPAGLRPAAGPPHGGAALE